MLPTGMEDLPGKGGSARWARLPIRYTSTVVTMDTGSLILWDQTGLVGYYDILVESVEGLTACSRNGRSPGMALAQGLRLFEDFML